MGFINSLKGAYLSYLSRPLEDRVLYRSIRKRQVRSILEIGIRSVRRTRVMLDLAVALGGTSDVKYTGIDLFEGRPDGGDETARAEFSLKSVHRRLAGCHARIRLVPGDPYSALARTANELVGTDMIVIDVDAHSTEMERAWMYVPRMLHDGTVVFVAELSDVGGGAPTSYRLLDRSAIEGMRQRRRAA